ncbi:MAG: archease [Candidatus Omnitrophota bacterium]
MKKNYSLIEHTADIGIKVRGRTKNELFKNSALAVFDIIAEKKPSKNIIRKNITVKLKADTLESLFIEWLNELISLSGARGLIFDCFKIDKLDNDWLKAVISGVPAENYRVNVEIKAATYHQLKIKKTVKGWLAEVILDV